jgi:hypothetical protein
MNTPSSLYETDRKYDLPPWLPVDNKLSIEKKTSKLTSRSKKRTYKAKAMELRNNSDGASACDERRTLL